MSTMPLRPEGVPLLVEVLSGLKISSYDELFLGRILAELKNPACSHRFPLERLYPVAAYGTEGSMPTPEAATKSRGQGTAEKVL